MANAMKTDPKSGAKMDPAINAERQRRQRGRNWAVMLALVVFCVVVYAITIVKLKGS
jgi:t-SNARE complex subunit (syntaxin)